MDPKPLLWESFLQPPTFSLCTMGFALNQSKGNRVKSYAAMQCVLTAVIRLYSIQVPVHLLTVSKTWILLYFELEYRDKYVIQCVLDTALSPVKSL